MNTLTLLPWTCRWWWPTLCLTRCRSCSVQKSKLWTSVWSWLRPSGASTTESPWPICSATLPWTTEATHFQLHSCAHTKQTLPSTHYHDQKSSLLQSVFQPVVPVVFLINISTYIGFIDCMVYEATWTLLCSSVMSHSGTFSNNANCLTKLTCASYNLKTWITQRSVSCAAFHYAADFHK